jgi:UMF1 family MFS transporter
VKIASSPPADHASWLNRQTMAWASYDVANSVYFGIAPTLLLPLYFTGLLDGYDNPTAAWGVLAAIAVLASSAVALAAAILSRHISRFRLLMAFTVGLVAALGGLAVSPGDSLLLPALGFLAAQCCYFAAATIYESYMPDLLPPDLVQRLSGFGWAIGYLGGMLGIIALLGFVSRHPAPEDPLQACIGILALLSALLFSIVLLWMRATGFTRLGENTHAAELSGFFSILSRWRAHRMLIRLLAGTILINMGIAVVVTFTAPILASRYGQTLPDLLLLLLMIHILSVPSTIIWNALLTRWSRLVPMCLLLASWGAVLLLLAFGAGPWTPQIVVLVIGCCLGATASSLRGFVAEIVPQGSAPAYFALATVAGRLAAAAGPALFAVISLRAGASAALISVLALVAAGAVLVVYHLVQGKPAQQANG